MKLAGSLIKSGLTVAGAGIFLAFRKLFKKKKKTKTTTAKLKAVKPKKAKTAKKRVVKPRQKKIPVPVPTMMV
jgi:hypothetical protein